MQNRMKQIGMKLWSDESGAETIEYALIIGLIVVGCVAVIGHVGTNAVARWKLVKKGI